MSSSPNTRAEARQRIRAYHQASKHHPHRTAAGPGRLDWANQPDPFRRFDGAPVVELPLTEKRPAIAYSSVRGGEPIACRPFNRRNVALLLEHSLGLSAWKSYRGNTWALRCNPSSGNLHPTEGYIVCSGIDGVDNGVYHYRSREHALEQRLSGCPNEWSAALAAPGLLLGLTSIYWREAWKYGMRAWRYCNHDVGHAIAAVRYAATALGWQCRLLDDWADADLAHLLGVDRSGDFHSQELETPDALLWIGAAPATPIREHLLANVNQGRWRGIANRLSSEHVQWNDIESVHQATYKPTTEPAGHRAQPRRPPPIPLTRDLDALTLFRQRRSAVAFDARTAIDASSFFAMLDGLLPRPGIAPWDALPWHPLIHPVLFVHRVYGLEAGLYVLARTPDLRQRLRPHTRDEWLWEPVAEAPAHFDFYRLLSADVREPARLISCVQDIASDSAFSLAMLADFDTALARGPWWYRYLYWEAGMLGQVLYLEAEAAGLRGTGIGCFFDDEMHRVLGLQGEQWQDVYHFTVGGPVDDARLMTLPPYSHLRRERPGSGSA